MYALESMEVYLWSFMFEFIYLWTESQISTAECSHLWYLDL